MRNTNINQPNVTINDAQNITSHLITGISEIERMVIDLKESSGIISTNILKYQFDLLRDIINDIDFSIYNRGKELGIYDNKSNYTKDNIFETVKTRGAK